MEHWSTSRHACLLCGRSLPAHLAPRTARRDADTAGVLELMYDKVDMVPSTCNMHDWSALMGVPAYFCPGCLR